VCTLLPVKGGRGWREWGGGEEEGGGEVEGRRRKGGGGEEEGRREGKYHVHSYISLLPLHNLTHSLAPRPPRPAFVTCSTKMRQ